MNSNVTILERFFDKLLAQNCRVKCIKLKVKKKKEEWIPQILSYHLPSNHPFKKISRSYVQYRDTKPFYNPLSNPLLQLEQIESAANWNLETR